MNRIDNQRGGVIVTILIVGLVAFTLYENKKIISYIVSKTARELISENLELKRIITNLTEEDQIGFAKVVSQSKRDGRLFTKLRFVETDRNNPNRKILKKEYEIEGDVIHFDVLIIKFSTFPRILW